jgi:hypothetical protein
MINIDILNWFSNLINFLIFAFIAVNLMNTQCFNVFQMSLSLVGLLASIFVQMTSIIIKNRMEK